MNETTDMHWWDMAAAAFDAWLARQTDEVQELGLLEQIELYAQDDHHASE